MKLKVKLKLIRELASQMTMKISIREPAWLATSRTCSQMAMVMSMLSAKTLSMVMPMFMAKTLTMVMSMTMSIGEPASQMSMTMSMVMPIVISILIAKTLSMVMSMTNYYTHYQMIPIVMTQFCQ